MIEMMKPIDAMMPITIPAVARPSPLSRPSELRISFLACVPR